MFNGTTDALKKNPLTAKVGESVRVFFGVGGPNYTSSFVPRSKYEVRGPIISLRRHNLSASSVLRFV